MPRLKPFGVPANLAADLIGRRPDIVAARLRASAAASRIDVAHADFYPNINLTGYLGVQSLGLSTLLQPASQIGQIAPAIVAADLRSWPHRRRLSRRPRRI